LLVLVAGTGCWYWLLATAKGGDQLSPTARLFD
jgi:hypothetical protein